MVTERCPLPGQYSFFQFENTFCFAQSRSDIGMVIVGVVGQFLIVGFFAPGTTLPIGHSNSAVVLCSFVALPSICREGMRLCLHVFSFFGRRLAAGNGGAAFGL